VNFEELYQDVILDHSRRPRNFGELSDATATANGNNPMCGDDVTVQVQRDGDTLSAVKFTGVGCSICLATASLMTLKTKGKTCEQAKAMAQTFQNSMTSPVEAPLPPEFGDLRVLSGVRKFPQRVKCATLPWHALQEALG
jgi:nitrogen fixation NifU-like protein